MPEFVEGLNGDEIIEDFLDQIRKRLKGDCNLRSTDSYGRGYSGKASVHLELYALDVSKVDFDADFAPKELPPTPTETVSVHPLTVDEKVEVANEPNLKLVRSRLGKHEVEPAGAEPVRETGRRKYGNRGSLERTASGGAVDIE